MKIIGTGLTGLIGSRITECLSSEYEFENLSLASHVDITDKIKLQNRLYQSEAKWIFHFAAKTDVDSAEAERQLGVDSDYWKVNVKATEYIVDAAREQNQKVLYLSTDYVFDGQKDFYTEDDMPKPAGWYAETKNEGEKRVLKLDENGLVVRIANPYRGDWKGKSDFVHKILSRLENHDEVVAPIDQIFVTTYIDDIAHAIRLLVNNSASGIYHVVGNNPISPFKAASLIAEKYKIEDAKINPVLFSEYFKGKAPRPLRANLKNDKISKCGIRMRSFDEGLDEILRLHLK
jgi:dTDP-4-dehydrorhamnose reductase